MPRNREDLFWLAVTCVVIAIAYLASHRLLKPRRR